jgi:hypothetical protein
VHYVRHNKQYITLKEYKSIITQKQIRGGVQIFPESFGICKESKAEINRLDKIVEQKLLIQTEVEKLLHKNNIMFTNYIQTIEDEGIKQIFTILHENYETIRLNAFYKNNIKLKEIELKEIV